MSIALEHVNYIYSPGTAYEKRALNDISLEIGQGQFVGSYRIRKIYADSAFKRTYEGDFRGYSVRWTKHLCGRVRHEKTAQSGRSCVSVS